MVFRKKPPNTQPCIALSLVLMWVEERAQCTGKVRIRRLIPDIALAPFMTAIIVFAPETLRGARIVACPPPRVQTGSCPLLSRKREGNFAGVACEGDSDSRRGACADLCPCNDAVGVQRIGQEYARPGSLNDDKPAP